MHLNVSTLKKEAAYSSKTLAFSHKASLYHNLKSHNTKRRNAERDPSLE
jgi:hypothetical protein